MASLSAFRGTESVTEEANDARDALATAESYVRDVFGHQTVDEARAFLQRWPLEFLDDMDELGTKVLAEKEKEVDATGFAEELCEIARNRRFTSNTETYGFPPPVNSPIRQCWDHILEVIGPSVQDRGQQMCMMFDIVAEDIAAHTQVSHFWVYYLKPWITRVRQLHFFWGDYVAAKQRVADVERYDSAQDARTQQKQHQEQLRRWGAAGIRVARGGGGGGSHG